MPPNEIYIEKMVPNKHILLKNLSLKNSEKFMLIQCGFPAAWESKTFNAIKFQVVTIWLKSRSRNIYRKPVGLNPLPQGTIIIQNDMLLRPQNTGRF